MFNADSFLRSLRRPHTRTKELLVTLAICFNEETKVLNIPKGNLVWNIMEEPTPTAYAVGYYAGSGQFEPVKHKILLDQFFGYYVGYNRETNTLVWWDPHIP